MTPLDYFDGRLDELVDIAREQLDADDYRAFIDRMADGVARLTADMLERDWNRQ
jgi:hypothetical protein